MDSHEHEFHHSMKHLMDLLKRVLSQIPARPAKDKDTAASSAADSGVTMNFCFFNFVPMSPEEMDELEEIYESFMKDSDDRSPELKTELTISDMEFLRRNGIRF